MQKAQAVGSPDGAWPCYMHYVLNPNIKQIAISESGRKEANRK